MIMELKYGMGLDIYSLLSIVQRLNFCEYYSKYEQNIIL